MFDPKIIWVNDIENIHLNIITHKRKKMYYLGNSGKSIHANSSFHQVRPRSLITPNDHTPFT